MALLDARTGVALTVGLLAACGGPSPSRLCTPPASQSRTTDVFPRRDPRAPLGPEMRDFELLLRSGRAACDLAGELVAGAARIAAAPTPPAIDPRQYRANVLVLRVNALQLADGCKEDGAGDLGAVRRAFDEIVLPVPC